MTALLDEPTKAPPFAVSMADARALSVEFGNDLANHLPMMLWAQHRLGGSDADVARFSSHYVAANDVRAPQPSPGPIEAAQWTDHLGDRRYQTAYRGFFAAEFERLGEAGLLETYLPTLVPGMAASALHALMRLAYALDADASEETATALAYAATTYLALGSGVGGPPRTPDPGAVLALMTEVPELRAIRSDVPLLWHFMLHSSKQPAFTPVYDWLEVGDDTLERMARDSLRLFAATMDFSALHAVTGTHWLRLVVPHLADPEPLVRTFWQAIAALYPKIGFPAPLDHEAAADMAGWACPDWDEIKVAAVASNDEHDLSLVYSAIAEQAIYGGRLYQVVAARRVGLID